MLAISIINLTNAFSQETINANEYQSFDYNGVDEVYLGQFNALDTDNISLANHREYDTYQMYDQGIVQKWNWKSNPYFIVSVAKGASYQDSMVVTATVRGSVSGNFPSKAKLPIFKAFGMDISGDKSIISKIICPSGPESNKRTRNYYYKKATHKHLIKIVQKHKRIWDGVLWTKTHYAYMNEPAIYNYSEDE